MVDFDMLIVEINVDADLELMIIESSTRPLSDERRYDVRIQYDVTVQGG